jgi:hypothetical protein
MSMGAAEQVKTRFENVDITTPVFMKNLKTLDEINALHKSNIVKNKMEGQPVFVFTKNGACVKTYIHIADGKYLDDKDKLFEFVTIKNV